jgi:glycosyltransferase involved in cell wall biosynthesis
MKILHVIPSLEYSGATSGLKSLAWCQVRSGDSMRVFNLGPETAFCAELASLGVPVRCGDWRRWIDIRPLMTLRQEVREFSPDVIHAWGLPALRAVAAVGGRRHPVILSGALSAGRSTSLGRFDRTLISWCGRRVTVRGPAEAERYRSLGVSAEKIVEVPPAVIPTAPTGLSHAEVCRLLHLPDNARYLCAVGPLEPSKGLRDAIWAFDILHFLFDDLYLLIIGVGPEAPRLREFAQIARVARRVQFLGRRADLRTLMTHAEIVWVPSSADRGLNIALEAMAAGKPVIASRWPMLTEAVIDGETGVLVAPGDKGALARETRLLLDDPERRTRLGNAGRRRAEERFGLEAMKRRFDEVYPIRTPG